MDVGHARSSSSSRPDSAISARQTSTACSITRCTSTEAMASVSRPVVARVRSSRSSISRASSWTLRWIIASVGSHLRLQVGPLQEIGGRQQDRGQGRAELVAQDRQEPILGAAGRLGRLLGDLQLLVLAPPLRDVAEGDDGPAALAVGVSQRPRVRQDPPHPVRPRPLDDQLQVVELLAPQGAAERSGCPLLVGLRVPPASDRPELDHVEPLLERRPDRARSRTAPGRRG